MKRLLLVLLVTMAGSTAPALGAVAINDYAEKLVVRSEADGNHIVLSGVSQEGFDPATSKPVVAAFNPDGSHDTSFGTGGDGGETLPVGPDARGDDIDLRASTGGLTIAGPVGDDVFVARTDKDGNLLRSYGGGDGVVTIDVPGAAEYVQLAPGSGGADVLAVDTGSNVYVFEVSSSGELDTTLGFVQVVIGGTSLVTLADLEVHDGGVIDVAGMDSSGNATVFELNPSGSFNMSFGPGGFSAPAGAGTIVDLLQRPGGGFYYSADSGGDLKTGAIDSGGAVLIATVTNDLGGQESAGQVIFFDGDVLVSSQTLGGPQAANTGALLLDADTLAKEPRFNGTGMNSFASLSEPESNGAFSAGLVTPTLAVLGGYGFHSGTQSSDFMLWGVKPDGTLGDFGSGGIAFRDLAGETPAEVEPVSGGGDGPGSTPLAKPFLSIVKEVYDGRDFRVRDPGYIGSPLEASIPRRGVGQAVRYRITVSNFSFVMTDIKDLEITDSFGEGFTFAPGSVTVTRRNLRTQAHEPGDKSICGPLRDGGALVCAVAKLEAAQAIEIEFEGYYDDTGYKINKVNTDTPTPTDPSNVSPYGTHNEPAAVVNITAQPDSRIDPLDPSFAVFSGIAAEQSNDEPDVPGLNDRRAAHPAAASLNRLARVDIALNKVAGKRARCLWLRTARPSFRRVKARGGKCDRPVWLKAKGTRHWRYKLRRRLPAGRYVLLSRAVNRAGVAEERFTARDKNRRLFRVR